jgi:hypothetical protein
LQHLYYRRRCRREQWKDRPKKDKRGSISLVKKVKREENDCLRKNLCKKDEKMKIFTLKCGKDGIII